MSKHGSVYVIEFSNGTVKVGMSSNPESRLRNHQYNAEVFGISIARSWISEYLGNADEVEVAVLDAVAATARRVVKREWLQGASYEAVADIAATVVQSEGVPQERVTATRSHRRSNVDWTARAAENQTRRVNRHERLVDRVRETVGFKRGSCVQTLRLLELVNEAAPEEPASWHELRALLDEAFPRRRVATKKVHRGAREFTEWHTVEEPPPSFRVFVGIRVAV